MRLRMNHKLSGETKSKQQRVTILFIIFFLEKKVKTGT